VTTDIKGFHLQLAYWYRQAFLQQMHWMKGVE
jgi:hypothetical protein